MIEVIYEKICRQEDVLEVVGEKVVKTEETFEKMQDELGKISPVSYAEKVKAKKPEPVVIIKPKNVAQKMKRRKVR